jgi:hypothetical protein
MSLRSVSSLAALLCAALLLCLYRPRVPTPAHAAGKDEMVWRGTVTVVDTVNLDKDETNQGPIGVDGGYGTNHHINREQSRRSYRYSGIRAAPDSETSWSGPADVNLNIDAHTYNMDHETVVLPAYVKYNRITNSEHGFEATTSGATVAQGVVKFYRNRKEDDPRKAECRIEVDADEDWRDRPELTVWMVGKGWEKGDNNHSENEQKTRQILAPHFVGIDFDCDPEASSYSGEQREHAAGSPDTHVVTWNIHGGPDPDTEVELIPPKEYDQWRPEGGRRRDDAWRLH